MPWSHGPKNEVTSLNQQLRTILDEVGGLSRPASTLDLDDDLFAAGLTSFSTIGLMLAIEDEYDIVIPDTLLVRATFRSIAALGGVIVSLQGHARVA